jgi:hypothetical protein
LALWQNTLDIPGQIIQQIKIKRPNKVWVVNSMLYDNSWCYGIGGRWLKWRDYVQCNEMKRWQLMAIFIISSFLVSITSKFLIFYSVEW